MAKPKSTANTPIESVTHKDSRKHIPTREQGELVADDEAAPPSVFLKRNKALDPQLMWRGKDEADAQDLEVPALPIYIQETLHPHALIESLRAESRADDQLEMFSTVQRKMSDEERFGFYEHEDNWRNRMILGDSLLVMTSLAEKEGLRGKVQTIFMDPPYGIKFQSNWQVSTRKRDVKDGNAQDLVRQPEQIKAFRDTWELGIHSYLSYLRDRLIAARELLTESGSLFMQIGDENVHLVRSLMDEVFGRENFETMIIFSKTSGASGNSLAGVVDFVLWYTKSKESAKVHPLFLKKLVGVAGASQYTWLLHDDGSIENAGDAASEYLTKDGIELFAHGDITSQRPAQGLDLREFTFDGTKFELKKGTFKTDPNGMRRLASARRLLFVGNTLRYLRKLKDLSVYPLNNLWTDTGTSGFADKKMYVVQTNLSVIQRCVLMTSDPGDLVLDPTCGSGTTALLAEEWGRRWITIDTSRVAIALARARLMAARLPHYLLLDSQEGYLKECEITAQYPETRTFSDDVRQGFVCERVAHVTLKSIANNEEIDTIHARHQPDLDRVRAELNGHLKKPLEEWEIPRKPLDGWPDATGELLSEWWRLRILRQKEIDASIARRAETELLYDQPYEDPKRVRVSGPFTVESLSPHRVLSSNLDRPKSEAAASQEQGVAAFVTMILDNLRKAGVQNTVKGERLVFDRLDAYPGRWLQAAGEYTEKGGKLHRVAVAIGPEHGTVGPQLIKEALDEARAEKSFETVVVCGFAFDPHVERTAVPSAAGGLLTAEAAAPQGPVLLLARMNPDLAMGDELLKKTGAGNLFMVFGEPDIELKQQPDKRWVVELKGVDVYDPTTGEVRSHSTSDIACWFLDTAYDGQCFVVRHAYFTGEKDTYDKLKRALKSDIDEAAWRTVYQTTSRPFERPSTGHVAVKVINHYGDEVLKVYPVS